MDVDHVAFAGLRKFDGRRTRGLHAQEIAQIAGRAGRFRKDGAFGVTGDAPDLDPDVVAAVEGHVFPPVVAAEWRNARLDFQSLQGLMRSLAAPPPAPGLRLSEESQDETTLRQLSTDELVIRRSRDRANLMRLWEVCQTPDFRKTTQDEHARLIGDDVRASDAGRPAAAGGLDAGPVRRPRPASTATSTRCRRASPGCAPSPMSPIAPTGSPIRQAWQGRARALEDRLSDTLHQSLMQRFVDRRTSALLRSLNERAGPILGGIGADGAVTVEGHLVGRLVGVHFEPERAATRRWRTARCAARSSGRSRRRSRAGSASSRARATRPSRSAPGGVVAWRGEPAGEIAGGAPFAPRVRLIGEFGAEPQRERAARRLEAFVAAEASRRLARSQAAEGGDRGRAAQGTGARPRLSAGRASRRAGPPGGGEQDSGAEPAERRMLKGLGVRFGAFSLYLPSLLTPEAQLVGAAFAELGRPGWRPDAGGLDRPAAARAAARGAVAARPARGRRARGADRGTRAAGRARPRRPARGRRRRAT